MKRIIDKTTGLFLRDDFTFNEETEIGLEVNPAQGLYQPKWENEMWVEGLTVEEIEEIKFNVVNEPSEMDILQAKIAELTETINILIDNEE